NHADLRASLLLGLGLAVVEQLLLALVPALEQSLLAQRQRRRVVGKDRVQIRGELGQCLLLALGARLTSHLRAHVRGLIEELALRIRASSRAGEIGYAREVATRRAEDRRRAVRAPVHERVVLRVGLRAAM